MRLMLSCVIISEYQCSLKKKGEEVKVMERANGDLQRTYTGIKAVAQISAFTHNMLSVLTEYLGTTVLSLFNKNNI